MSTAVGAGTTGGAAAMGGGGGGGGAGTSSQFHSLVKYDNPTLVSKTGGDKAPHRAALGTHGPGEKGHHHAEGKAAGAAGAGGAAGGGAAAAALGHGLGAGAGAASIRPLSPPGHGKAKQLPPVDDKGARARSPTQAEDILNSILPPREWEDNGQLWVQRVSSTPATRLDVINLQEQLDQMLMKRQARETGICPVRRELYSQCFDELIRQVTISCQERGLLLLRVRDEIRMSIAAYQTLYESSVAFGMRKALMAEWGKSDMEAKLKSLEEEKKGLEGQVAELKAKCEAIEKREAERRAMDERKHAEEIAFMKKTNLQLKTQLEGILAPQKK